MSCAFDSVDLTLSIQALCSGRLASCYLECRGGQSIFLMIELDLPCTLSWLAKYRCWFLEHKSDPFLIFDYLSSRSFSFFFLFFSFHHVISIDWPFFSLACRGGWGYLWISGVENLRICVLTSDGWSSCCLHLPLPISKTFETFITLSYTKYSIIIWSESSIMKLRP